MKRKMQIFHTWIFLLSGCIIYWPGLSKSGYLSESVTYSFLNVTMLNTENNSEIKGLCGYESCIKIVY